MFFQNVKKNSLQNLQENYSNLEIEKVKLSEWFCDTNLGEILRNIKNSWYFFPRQI